MKKKIKPMRRKFILIEVQTTMSNEELARVARLWAIDCRDVETLQVHVNSAVPLRDPDTKKLPAPELETV